MRKLRTTVLLGLAGMAWKAIKPKLPAAKARLAQVRGQLPSASPTKVSP